MRDQDLLNLDPLATPRLHQQLRLRIGRAIDFSSPVRLAEQRAHAEVLEERLLRAQSVPLGPSATAAEGEERYAFEHVGKRLRFDGHVEDARREGVCEPTL